MILRILTIVIVILSLAAVSGCRKKAEPAPTQAVQQTQENTAPITAETLDTELDKMEKEIDADIAAEQ